MSSHRNIEYSSNIFLGNVDNDILLSWLKDQLKEEPEIAISDIGSIFKDGKALCAIIHHYRPDLLDYHSIKNDDPTKNNQLALDVLEKEMGMIFKTYNSFCFTLYFDI